MWAYEVVSHGRSPLTDTLARRGHSGCGFAFSFRQTQLPSDAAPAPGDTVGLSRVESPGVVPSGRNAGTWGGAGSLALFRL